MSVPSRKRGRENSGETDNHAPDIVTDSPSVVTAAACLDLRRHLNDKTSLPRLVVLDLDYTLWPFYCHEQTTGPYTRSTDHGAVQCRTIRGATQEVKLFPHAMDILRCLREQDSIRLAVASRSPLEAAGKGILKALDLLPLFCHLEIHRGSKATHFENIAAATGVPYRDMIFFDDDPSNVNVVSRLGVCSVLVKKESGLTFEITHLGLKKYGAVCKSRSSLRAWLQPPKSNGTPTTRSEPNSENQVDAARKTNSG